MVTTADNDAIGGVIAIWHDISDEGTEDFYEWHNREHIPERVGIPGFLNGRRYWSKTASPAFFTLYDVADPAVLASPAYHQRLNHPTKWTQRAVQYFSNESRSLCSVEIAAGLGWGGMIGTVHFHCDPDVDRQFLDGMRPLCLTMVRRQGIVSMRVCRADLETSGLRSAEQEGRDDNRVPRWVILVEGSTDAAVLNGLSHLEDQPWNALAVGAEYGAYQLQFALAKGEVTEL